jgi:hypothetical protein
MAMAAAAAIARRFAHPTDDFMLIPAIFSPPTPTLKAAGY